MILVPRWGFAQTSFTVNCYPPSETYATGYTDGSTKTSGDMHCVGGNGVQGWMKFDVSSIPDFATISSIKLHFYNTSTNNCYVKLTAAGQNDPANTAASTLYNAIKETSPNYYTSTYISGLGSAGWKNFTLSSSAVSNLQSSGLTNDYFTIGFYEYESSSSYYLYTYGYDNTTYRPYIEVTYTASITEMHCGQTYTGTLGTSGTWTEYTGCSYQDKGEEHIYAYTPPVTGSYTFTGTATSGDPDFWLMESCSNTATNMLGSDCWNAGTKSATLTGGHTYYLIVDNYSNSNNAGYEVSVECKSFNITVWTSGNGTVSGGGTYASEASCTISATPSSGYVFDHWVVNGTGNDIYTNPYTFTVAGDADFQAVFIVDPCPAITTFPWTEDFESMTTSTVPDCWDNSASTSSTINNNPERIWGVYGYNSNKMLRMYNFYVRQGTALINTPSITLPAAPQEFSFDYSHLASCGTFYVKISQDGGTTFTNLWSHGANSTSYDYTDPGTFNTSGTIDLSAYANSTVIIQFYAEADYGSGAIFVDNINIASSCPAPTGLALSGITTQAVTATWNAAAGDEFDYAIVSGANVNPATVTTYEGSITASGSTCSKTWSNLSPDSDYTVVIRKVCGNNDYSQPVSASFTTEASNCPKPTNLTVSNLAASHANVSWDSEAGNYTVKYSTATVTGTTLDPVFEDGFESGIGNWTTYAMGYDNSITNWQQMDASTIGSNGVYDSNHSGNYSAMSRSWHGSVGDQSVDNWLVTPQMTLGDVVKFWVACNDGYRDSYAVYVSTGSNIVTSSTSIGDFVLVKSYAEATGTWTEIPVDISAYAGQQGYVAIRHTNYGGDHIYIDDFGVYNTINTYSYGGWTTVSPNPTTESCQLTGLSAETLYAVQVQANCGGTDGSSAWSTIYFTTPDNCGAPQELASSNVTATSATLSWADDKDSYNLQYRKVYFYEDFEGSDGIPTGWTTINNSTTAGSLNWQVLHLTNHSGNNSVGSGSYIYQNTGITPDNWLISPQLDLQGTLRVWLTGYGDRYSEHFEILLSTTGTSVSDFTTTLVAESTTTNSYVEYTADLSSYSGKGYIAIHHFNCSDQNYLCVDDFGLYGSENWVALNPNPTTETANLIGLAPNTGYEWQVRGENCDGNGGTTEWSAPATFTTREGQDYILHIDGYTAGSNDGWYLITSPLDTPVIPTDVTNMTSNTYDLYRFDQSPAVSANGSYLEWINYKNEAGNGVNENFGSLEAGKGYLYANEYDVDLIFTGTAYSENGEISLIRNTSNPDSKMWGWNLIGNPFTEEADVSADFMELRDGLEIILCNRTKVDALEGIFAYAAPNVENPTFTFSRSRSKSTANNERIVINISQNQKVIDRAAVRFGEGQQLPKYQLNQNSTKVYIPVDGEEFAVVRSEGIGALPVNFKAQENGNYTLSLNTEGVSFGYLHLIDNMTGNDVDMLANPSYSFEARTTDYSQRFKLVFATGDNANANFAYFSNGSFVINNEGKATLQVIDVTGRILKSESINGCTNVNVNAAPGVYMIRLINGDNVKVQKVFVK